MSYKIQPILRDTDLSFMDIRYLSDLQVDVGQLEPRDVGIKKEIPTRNAEGKFETRVVRFNNNRLESINDLTTTLEAITADVNILTWLDFSFNLLTIIDKCFCQLPSLQILYLHGNCITNLNEVDKLGGVSPLRKLTLHGNPIATERLYKQYVLKQIKHLISFDMTLITKADRMTRDAIWGMKQPKNPIKSDTEFL